MPCCRQNIYSHDEESGEEDDLNMNHISGSQVQAEAEIVTSSDSEDEIVDNIDEITIYEEKHPQSPSIL